MTIKIGFLLKWKLGSLGSKSGNVLGDELYALSLANALLKLSPEVDAQVYAPNRLPKSRLDVMVYMNDNELHEGVAEKSVLYLQNGYGEGSDHKLNRLRKRGYHGYAFISQKLLEMHLADGYQGIYLPFGVDINIFYPRPREAEFAFDVAYVGNDIKGTFRSEAYLEPAADFNFGLFGNWQTQRARLRIWKNWQLPRYKKRFAQLSRGKIPQEKVPILYSSSRINLNCTIQDCVDWDVITLRTLEVLACDGFLISDRVPSAERLFGDYICFTDGHEDLSKKIRYYLMHINKSQQMARRGGEFVRQNFSIESIARKLLNYVEEI